MRFIGSKRLLVGEIQNLLQPHLQGEEKSFLDLFGGTNVVANAFKRDFTVYSNDLLYFSYLHAKATLENNERPRFEKLKLLGIDRPLDELAITAEKWIKEGRSGYYENSYSPTGGAKYLSVQNAKRVDAMRGKIDEWRLENLLTSTEYAYLVSSLIQAIPRISNITGTYGAYLKQWDKRALMPLELEPLEVFNNARPNQSFNEDAEKLVSKISADIVYIDTPYNNRQYASNYHLLENVARNDQPALRGKTKIFDWSELKSNFATQKYAHQSMENLLSKVNSQHLILSYNNEGIIPEQELLKLVEKFSQSGSLEIQRIPYRKYRSKVPSLRNDLYEILIYCKPRQTPQRCKTRSTSLPPGRVNETWIPTQGKLLKSPLNYVGGKYRLLKQILPLFPKQIETYIEPFSGAANVGINVQARRHIFNDMNGQLNSMFRYFANVQDVDHLIDRIWARISELGLSKTNEEAYKAFRTQYNINPNPLDLFILTSFSYNYQLRFNSRLEYNNPFGRNRSAFSKRTEENLRRFIARLHEMDVQFTDRFFQDIDFSKLGPNDFVYLDPPYLITTGSYNDGNRGFRNWDELQEANLYRLLKQLNEQEVPWALSNVTKHKGTSNEILLDFIRSERVRVHPLNFGYKNSSYNTSKKSSNEVLVTNYTSQPYSDV